MRDKLRNHLLLTEIGWKLEVVAAREGEERATFFAFEKPCELGVLVVAVNGSHDCTLTLTKLGTPCFPFFPGNKAPLARFSSGGAVSSQALGA